MKKNVLVDSSVIISFFNDEDSNHKKAIQSLNEIQDLQMWLTDHIVDEVTTVLNKKGKKNQLERFKYYLDSNIFEIFIPQKVEDNLSLISDVISRVINSKGVASFTDILSLEIIERELIPDVELLSYDHHHTKKS